MLICNTTKPSEEDRIIYCLAYVIRQSPVGTTDQNILIGIAKQIVQDFTVGNSPRQTTQYHKGFHRILENF
jgi:hypothetical protein